MRFHRCRQTRLHRHGAGRQRPTRKGCRSRLPGRTLRRTTGTVLPEADAVLGFDAYPELPSALRTLCRWSTGCAPPDRRGSAASRARGPFGPTWLCCPAWGMRRRLSDGPVASVKLASGCDRRCTFCAIPSFRGSSFRRPTDVVNEVAWLVGQGRAEVNLVSENSTSYGRTSVTCGSWRACCRPRGHPAWNGCALRICSLPRCARSGVHHRCHGGVAPTSTCRSSTPVPRCCAGCAGSADRRTSCA